jgi:hypothetical protein
MKASEIIATSTNLGKITRTFKASLENFSTDLDREVQDVRGAVLAVRGWEGTLYDGFREKIMAELKELDKLSRQSDHIAEKLEDRAKEYDVIIEKLRRAGSR